MIFYLGSPKAAWLERTDIPLFVSYHAFRGRKKLPRARGIWALDSGGFTQLSQHGKWTITPEEYVDFVRRAYNEIGGLQWAAIQDFMCEPWVLEKTGKTIDEHQRLTIESYLRLRDLGGPELEHLWAPTLQGWVIEDYLEHFQKWWIWYGIDVRQANVVGVGSVCRRAGTDTAAELFRRLRNDLGIRRLHAFGNKRTGLALESTVELPTDPRYEAIYERAAERGVPLDLLETWLADAIDGGQTTWEKTQASVCKLLFSADSMAWSRRARGQRQNVVAKRNKFFGRGNWFDAPGEIVARLPDCSIRRIPINLAKLGRPEADAPTQIRRECAERAQEGQTHESCNSCLAWALEWRGQLMKALPEPCREVKWTKRKLPAPPLIHQTKAWKDEMARVGEIAARFKAVRAKAAPSRKVEFDPLELKAVEAAATGFVGGVDRWARLARRGATDQEVLEAIGDELGISGGRQVDHDGRSVFVRYTGGKVPSVEVDHWNEHGLRRKITGKKLVRLARAVFGVGAAKAAAAS